MDIAISDRVRYRKLRHATRMTADLRAADATAEECLGNRLTLAATALLDAAVAGYRPDDDAVAAVRTSEQTLRDGLRQVVVALRRAGASSDDPDGIDALIDSAFPDGRPANVSSGPPLQAAAERFRNAVRPLSDELAGPVDALLSAYTEALDAANARVDAIDPTQHTLIKARAEADRWIRAGRAFVTYKVESEPTCGVAFDDVWPVGEQGSFEDQNARLDDCGVPEPEDEQPEEEVTELDENS